MTKPVTFNLQIFVPGVDGAPLSIDSSTPFGSFSAGDIFNTKYGKHFSHIDGVAGANLQIEKVEHGIMETDKEIKHYIRLHTQR